MAAARLAAELVAAGGAPTSKQRETLRGWSSLAQWIGSAKGVEAAGKVGELWPGYEQVAAASMLNAYYTDTNVIGTVWSWLERNGVTDGHGWEPGCGRGDWMTMAPRGVTFDAVDIDPVSVAVARMLSGQHVEQARIEEWDVTRSSRPLPQGYDFVVGNVPFSAVRPGRNNPDRDNLHNLAVLRSAELLRPGGVIAVLTSRFALDAHASAGWRRRLHQHVDLVAAFRLPAGTHRSAGTDVVTDLLILRRPSDGAERPVPDWLDVTTFDLDGETFRHNGYFDAHPDRVLGRYEPGGAYRRENLNVIADQPAHRLLGQALEVVSIDYRPNGAAPQRVTHAATSPSGRRLPAGSIVVDAAMPSGFARDRVEHKVPKSSRAQVLALCELRDKALDYLDRPTDEGRAELADLYSAYREVWPPLNDFTLKRIDNGGDDDNPVEEGADPVRTRRVYPRLGGFRSDPSWWNVAALESFDPETHEAVPAPILQRAVLAEQGERWPAAADTLAQAVANSLARFHGIDQDYIADQLDVDVDDARGQLAAVAYERPTGGWEVAATYLAGDVVGKLEEAEAHAATDERFARNVDALRAALPTPLTQADIAPEMGVTWLAAEDVTEFVRSVTGAGDSLRIKYHPPTGRWSHDGWAPAGPAQYRTTRHPVVEQVIRACNALPTTVNVEIEVGDSKRTIVDQEATAAEQLARDNLNEALQEWCWSDPARADVLVGRYNRMFNRYRAVNYDGSHLTLPGLASDFTPRPHQKNIVWRVLTSLDDGVLMAHGVGAGKTAAMAIAGHEARRTGRVTGTTLYAVPGNMVEQAALEYLRLYPADRVITPAGSDRDSIREFAARVATGDYDAAICSHNAIKTIPFTPEAQERAVNMRLADFEGHDLDATVGRSEMRRVQRRLDGLRQKLTQLADEAEDPTITYFDRMRIGMMFVDELQLAKNIDLMTARQGLPLPEPSQLAEAVLARADWVREHNGAGSVVGATATPVTNSPAEMWVMARILAPNTLEKAGIRHFDGFAANFLSPVESIEHTAGGNLKVVTRLADYRNFPDLGRLFRSFTDVRETKTLGFKLPELDGGQAQVHLVPPTEQQLDVAAWARERAEKQHLELPDGVNDPVIAILGATRAAALHPALVTPAITARWATRSFPNLRLSWDEPNPKIIAAADKIAEIYHRTADVTYDGSSVPGASQVVFIDMGTPDPTGGPSVYSILTRELVGRGVKRGQIAWVHDYPDPAGRQPLWDQVRAGHVRVLIGSTAQMGVGVNIQTRLVAGHELTAPYRPDWLTQAEGRFIRQGNHHDVVELHRYVSKRTADATSWQILQRKAHFIQVAMSDPDTLSRDLRDESVQTPAEEYASIAALATGDHRHVELAALTGIITRLERAERAHAASKQNQRRSIDEAQRRIASLNAEIDVLNELHPVEANPVDVGQQLLRTPSGVNNVTVAGVTFEVGRNWEGITLSLPGTSIWKSINNDRLDPHDGGRGLGTTVVNLIANIPHEIAGRQAAIVKQTRQLEAEQARPVPDQFARRAELNDARARHSELLAELHPREQAAPDAAAAGAGMHNVSPTSTPTAHMLPATTAPAIDATDVDEDLHPVFGDEKLSAAERMQWAGAYHWYDPSKITYAGNKAKGPDAWTSWVNALSLDPNNQHPARRHDIGKVAGVTLTAQFTATSVAIAPRNHTHPAFPAFIAEPGRINHDALSRWLANQRMQARVEMNAQRAAEIHRGRPPANSATPDPYRSAQR